MSSTFTSSNLFYYSFVFIVIIIAGFLAKKVKSAFGEKADEYELIKKYLLNENPLEGYNRPKIWIHSKYEINSRIWQSFQSRNTTELNQHYLHLTIKSIINYCGDEFNVCLIDDDSFSKLIPSWDVDLKNTAEPLKSKLREIGLMELVYFYGGIVVPNSFLCLQNLKPLYQNDSPFICEKVNTHLYLQKQKKTYEFIPDIYFIGSKKNNPVILSIVQFLKEKLSFPFFTEENEFLGCSNDFCMELVNSQKMNLISGDMIGIKTKCKKIITVEDLTNENFIEFNSDMYGIYLPIDDFLKRTKYNWFPIMSVEELLESNMIISKYFKMSIINSIESKDLEDKIKGYKNSHTISI